MSRTDEVILDCEFGEDAVDEKGEEEVDLVMPSGEEEIEEVNIRAHVVAFCLRCPRVVVAVLHHHRLPGWLTEC